MVGGSGRRARGALDGSRGQSGVWRRSSFAPGNTSAIIGNTLAERMQYDGWLETMLHARFPKHELVIRNLGFSGDEIATRPRSKNFGTPDEWLSGVGAPIGGREENRFAGTNTKADVVFAFFGYNESYAGPAGLDAFTKQLGDWITHTLAQRYNGKTRAAAGAVLADRARGPGQSRLARREGEQPAAGALHPRDGGRRQGAQGDVRRSLRGERASCMRRAKAPLTMQGVHLNAEGNRRIAEVIDRALFGAPQKPAEPYLTRLRQAVVDKNLHWFHRYRVTDGYSTYGDRAFLTFVRGTPTNVNADTAGEDAERGRPAEQLRRPAARAADPGRDDGEPGPSNLGRRARRSAQVRSEDRRRRHAAVRGREDELCRPSRSS